MDTIFIRYVFLCIWASSIIGATNEEGCKSPQYLELGKPGVINCSLQRENIAKIAWYFSAVTDKPIVSYNGSHTHGAGHLSNEYDIHPDGSLRISNVSAKHDSDFTLVALDARKDEPTTYVVSVVTVDNADEEIISNKSDTFAKRETYIVIAALIAITLLVITVVIIIIHRKAHRRNGIGAPVESGEENIPMFPEAGMAGITSCNAKMKTLIEHLKNEYQQLYAAARQQESILKEHLCIDEVYMENGMELFTPGEGLRGIGIWKRLDSRHQVFDEFLRGKPYQPSACILDGNFGFGKSVLSLQLAHDWCTSNPESPLKLFEILILLRMSQLQRPVSIAAAIKQLIVPENDDFTENDIDEFLKTTESCVVILDGFEQYPCRTSDSESEIIQLSRSEIYQNFKVIVTTRYHPTVNYDVNAKRVRMIGFDEKARDDYISELLSKGEDQVAENLKLCLEEYPDFCDLCQAPMFFFAFVNSFYNSKFVHKIQPITNVVDNIVSCFYSHNRDKGKISKQNEFESNYHDLRKMAFQGLTKMETINWKKTDIRTQIGEEFYDHLVWSGILLEWDVIDWTKPLSDSCMHYMTMVGFYNRIICQWYAAQYIKDVFLHETNEEFTACLHRLRVKDLSLVLRFICGLEHTVVRAVSQHLKIRKYYNHLTVMCVMEQCGDLDVIVDTTKELCGSSIEFTTTDSAYQQKTSLNFLSIASRKEVAIAQVVLKNCFGSVNLLEKSIILASGQRLSSATNMCDLVIVEEERTLTAQETRDVICFAMECQTLNTLRFQADLLPETLNMDISQPSNIEVLWSPRSGSWFLLDMDSGCWKVKEIADEDITREVPPERPTMEKPNTSNSTAIEIYSHR